MAEGIPHRAFVNAWLTSSLPRASTEQVLQRFEDGFRAMWTRAHLTLGEVTLTAILDRVICDATERHVLLSTLEVHPDGLRFDRLRAASGELSRDEAAAIAETVLVEFLTVLGNLTAEILTPALHAALSGTANGNPGEDPTS